MAKIVFLCDHSYGGEDLRTKPLGGIPTSTICLAEALDRRGHDVEIHNTRDTTETYRNITYRPLGSNTRICADLIISNISSRHFQYAKSGTLVAWQHNRTSLSRIWKRREVLPLLRFRPNLVTLSHDALAKTPKYIPYQHRYIIPHAIDDGFLLPADGSGTLPDLKAFFASRPSRNLVWVIECWKTYIHPQLPDAEFHVFMPPRTTFKEEPNELIKFNIHVRGSVPKEELARFVGTSRMLLYPGHINETGCQVALQAIGLGIPIISCGIGSLKDLVKHQQTGFIETEMENYANRAIECFTNDSLWKELRHNTLNHEWRKSYDERAVDWERTFIAH